MKLSLNWLKDYIDPKLSTDELIHRLTMAGLEVEATEHVHGDTVLELEITPNRPDCLNTLGLAREIGAITAKAVKYPAIKSHKPTKAKISVSIEDKKDCSRYIATLIKDTHISNAPQDIKIRIEALGIRGINNAVDITNFVMMEMGQPLHVFDYDKLAGGKIIVRRAKAGETIVTLDGVERKLDPSILVIADAEKPVAIAGIMGGKDSEITASTKNILLESAHFDLGCIRHACRTLGLRSDSSYRFERNVDLEGVLTGANRATDLLLSLTGGTYGARSEAGINKIPARKAIALNPTEIESLLGIKISLQQAKSSLLRLDLKVTAKGKSLSVIPPSFRGDLKQSVDLIEEIARIIGFDHLPFKLPLIKATNIVIDQRPRQVKNLIRRTLTGCGINEIVTFSMTNTRALAKSGLSDLKALKVFNPLSQDQELMRPALLPSMLPVTLTNVNRGQKDLRFFELGKRYFPDGSEKNTLGILLTGHRHDDWRANKKEMIEIFDLKGVLQAIFMALDLKISFESVPGPSFDPQCAAAIHSNGKCVGALGKIDAKVLNQWDIKTNDVYFAEVDVEALMAIPKTVIKYQPSSEFPAMARDVSLAVKKEITYAQVEAICKAQGSDILKNVQFIEQYIGDKVQAGHKALVFSCIYQSNTRTLREDEVNATHERILNSLIKELAAARR